jgi:hypothetical protein
MRRRLLLAGLAFFTASSIWAQDPTKVDPKHCKVDFEDSRVRVLHWSVGPHEKVPMHEHANSMVISLTGGRTRFLTPDGKTRDLPVKAGKVSQFVRMKHAAENLSDQPSESIEIELKGKPAKEEERITLRLRGTRPRGTSRAQWLSQILAHATRAGEGSQPNGTPPSGEDPCQPEHGKYKGCWGDWGSQSTCMSGDAICDCMSGNASGCADGNCMENACQVCGGSWQSTGSGSGQCIPADFPCCALLLPNHRGVGNPAHAKPKPKVTG